MYKQHTVYLKQYYTILKGKSKLCKWNTGSVECIFFYWIEQDQILTGTFKIDTTKLHSVIEYVHFTMLQISINDQQQANFICNEFEPDNLQIGGRDQLKLALKFVICSNKWSSMGEIQTIYLTWWSVNAKIYGLQRYLVTYCELVSTTVETVKSSEKGTVCLSVWFSAPVLLYYHISHVSYRMSKATHIQHLF